MTAWAADEVRQAGERIVALAEELRKRGFFARIVDTQAGEALRLVVANPLVDETSDDVVAGPSQDGSWWFWWPQAVCLGHISDVETAASAITRLLRPVATD
jgi:hypothetical protein